MVTVKSNKTDKTFFPLYEQVSESLIKDIRKFPVGSRFYTDREVCKIFQVSPQVSRSAFSCLVEKGYIRRVVSKGTFVSSHTPLDEKKKSLNIGVFCPLGNSGHASALDPIEKSLADNGHKFIIRNIKSEAVNDPNAMLESNVNDYDGIIWISGISMEIHNTPSFLRKNAEKLVFVNALYLDGKITCVMRDDRAAAFTLTSHLIDSGHRNIGFIGGPAGRFVSEMRFAGYEQALTLKKLKHDDRHIIRYSDGMFYDDGLKLAEELLRGKNLPDSIVCVTDSMASGLITKFLISGIKVPDDVAVVGFDNTHHLEHFSPGITSMDPVFPELGKAAVSLLLQQLNGESKPGAKHYVPCELHVRESCGSLKNNTKTEVLK